MNHNSVSAFHPLPENISSMPGVALAEPDEFSQTDTRREVIRRKESLREQREDVSREARVAERASPEKQALFRQVQELLDEEQSLEALLKSQFLPMHGAQQFLSPRDFFVSPLFRVKSKAAPRERFIEFHLSSSAPGGAAIRYAGPELRQNDGLVFLALVNMARDVRAGKPVSFSPEALCRALHGQYNGPVRARLRDTIQRLQQALLKFEHFSVQLCQRFDYPSHGQWTVAMDKNIVELFSRVPNVWLDISRRLSLPEGLSTWLYAFIESQTFLIPMKTSALRELCGSEAGDKPFENKLREALKHLNAHQVIDDGWRLEKGVLHWRKASRRNRPPEEDSATAAEPLTALTVETKPC